MKMSKLIASTIAIVMDFNIGLAQDFFSDRQSEQAEEQGFFQRDEAPAQGENLLNPGNPGAIPKAPIDDWLFLLPLLGIAVGGYYLLKHRRENVTE